ncbi:MAG: type III-A CRISPR-associated RAMP protein Csm4 [Muribaculaceae bacterium]|nr:type III-A CRISPR-associated RAMP protein Csm4 [Muribaculaceae bacterium]
MPSFKIIKMTEMSPMHIGLGRDSYDVSAGTLHSDTLTSALAAMRAMKGNDGDLPQFLESFALSSAFPYYKDTLFLPKPAGKLNVTVNGWEEKDYRKLLKKVKYVALPLWTELIKGTEQVVERNQLHGEYLLNSPDADFVPPMVSDIHQRVTVPRTDNLNATPFAFEWTFFRENCGLYCLLDAENEEIENEVIGLFDELGEQGIGSDRNVGGGHFKIDSNEAIMIPEVTDSNATMLVSMYIPTEQELPMLNVDKSRYQLLKRGGFIAGSSIDNLRHLRKNTIYMFTAGSVFNTSASVAGKVVDLRPAWTDGDLHPVYRSGKALSINIKTNWS